MVESCWVVIVDAFLFMFWLHWVRAICCFLLVQFSLFVLWVLLFDLLLVICFFSLLFVSFLASYFMWFWFIIETQLYLLFDVQSVSLTIWLLYFDLCDGFLLPWLTSFIPADLDPISKMGTWTGNLDLVSKTMKSKLTWILSGKR